MSKIDMLMSDKFSKILWVVLYQHKVFQLHLSFLTLIHSPQLLVILMASSTS